MNKVRVRVEMRRVAGEDKKEYDKKDIYRLLKLFKKECEKYRIMQTARDKQFYIRKTDIRKRKEKQKFINMNAAKREQQHQQVPDINDDF